MCGIAGIVSLDGAPVEGVEHLLATMTSLLRHRGPDSEGIWVSADRLLGLANTRLSIVGVGDDLEVPLRDPEGRGVLSFNGEIYNHKELRKRMAAHGRQFQTTTDTEVLLRGLLEEGTDFLDSAEGFWGFAFYDLTTSTLLIARDLMGEKSIYYAIENKCLYFASEIAPLLAVLPKENISINYESVVCGFQYRAAKPGETLIRNIKRLAPGCALSVNVQQRLSTRERLQQLRPEKWFDFFAADPDEKAITDLYAESIARACARRLPDEVDFFATLSGGLDSTLVNYFLSKAGTKPVNSLFGISTKQTPQRGADMGELEASRITAEKIGSSWRSFSMFDESAVTLYEKAAADSFDGVFCEGAANFQQLAAEARRTGKKVLLLSDGPDELLGGYDVDLAAFRWSERFARCPEAMRERLRSRAASTDHIQGRPSALLNWSYLASTPFAVRPNHGGTRPEMMAKIFSGEFVHAAYKAFGWIDSCYRPLLPHLDLSQKMALGYASTSLPDYVNTRSDRGTMKESIEARMPFQSVSLAELFIATPAKWRFRHGRQSKYLLRRLVKERIGPEIADRGKYGFAQPLWKLEGMGEKLRMREVIMDSPVFGDAPFCERAREIFADPAHKRLGWMAYCYAKSSDRLARGVSA